MNNTNENSINWWNLKLSQNDYSYLESAFISKKLSYNSVGADLEKKICKTLGCRYALVTTSGSAALLIALKSIGIAAGDEVIIPNRTFQATANAVHFLGASVKLADVDAQTGLIDIKEIEKKITAKTKAIIAVHLNGRGASIDEIKKIVQGKNIAVIEDAAQAFMSKSKNKYLGTLGDIGCFSFGVTKFITSGQGGAIVTDSPALYEEAKKYIFHAMSGNEDKSFNESGFNFRQSDLLSSLALSQLENIGTKCEKFLAHYEAYSKAIEKMSKISLIKSNLVAGEIPIWIEILTTQRDELCLFLNKKSIDSMKFYPSVNRSPYLKQTEERFVNSEIFESKGLILPCGPDLSEDDRKKVIDSLYEFESLGV